jgi:hypothetical protein
MLHPSSASHTALGYLSEAVVRYLHPRLITTAVYKSNAVLIHKRAESLLRLFALKILFKQPNRKLFAIFVLSRIVVECSLAR